MPADIDLTDPDTFADGPPHDIWDHLRDADPLHWHEPTAKRVAGLRTRAQLLRIPVLDRSALRDRETLVTALREIVQPAPKPR